MYCDGRTNAAIGRGFVVVGDVVPETTAHLFDLPVFLQVYFMLFTVLVRPTLVQDVPVIFGILVACVGRGELPTTRDRVASEVIKRCFMLFQRASVADVTCRIQRLEALFVDLSYSVTVI